MAVMKNCSGWPLIGSTQRKRYLNQPRNNSLSINLFSYCTCIVPSSFHAVQSGFIPFRSQTIIGGMECLAALAHAKTVIWLVLADMFVYGCFCTFSTMTFPFLLQRMNTGLITVKDRCRVVEDVMVCHCLQQEIILSIQNLSSYQIQLVSWKLPSFSKCQVWMTLTKNFAQTFSYLHCQSFNFYNGLS